MKTILVILDGWGMAPPSYGNAITSANTPGIKAIEESYPSLSLQASGIAVGLPWGEEGNSEVGHLNIGAGRTVLQYLPRIITAIREGSFFENKALEAAASHVKKTGSTLHLMGLVSSGSVHSYIDHLYGLFELAKREKISNVALHIFTDGKDSPPQEAAKLVSQLEERMSAQGVGSIASVIGRNYAMDRNENWQYTQKTYELLTEGKGEAVGDAAQYLEHQYSAGINDQHIEPAAVKAQNAGGKMQTIKEGDAVVFFNFREDSARQLTRAFIEENFDKFPRKKIPNLFFAAMTQYIDTIPPKNVAFPPPDISNPLGKVLADSGKKQLRIAESEKYAHITYFFNGLVERPFAGEERILLASRGSPRYEQNPPMQAIEITNKAVENMGKFDFILINFANADILAHTGSMEAAALGIEAVDKCLSRLIKSQDENTAIVITSDHGNAEEMLNPKTGAKKTEHTANPVPLYLVHPSISKKAAKKPPYSQKPQGVLADVAPTILEIMEIPPPGEMSGQSLLPKL